MVERGDETHRLEIVWPAGLRLVVQQPRCHCLLPLKMVLGPGQELRASWDPLELKVNPMSSPQYLVTLALSEKPIRLEMRADPPDALSTGWHISGSVG
jgi:hypothetical protein